VIKKELIKKVKNFLLIGSRRKLFYIQIQPPSIKGKYHSFYFEKNRVLFLSLIIFFILQGFAYYCLATCYFKYHYINNRYRRLRTIEKDNIEYKLQTNYYQQQLKKLKQKAYYFSDFNRNLIQTKELKPFSDLLMLSNATAEERDYKELKNYVENIHSRMEEMVLFYSDKTYRRLLFTPSILPLAEYNGITSPYGFRRSPFNREIEFHQGIDFSCCFGTDILAAACGEVICAGHFTLSPDFSGIRFGKVVVIMHGDSGFLTYYAHCSKVYVKKGQWVNKGQVIAASGSSGASTGPHLHYEVRFNHRPCNPINYLPDIENTGEKFADLLSG
jgi:murein DD-endopeptidase MepM/ murein hydrolase activator NlpD